MKNKKRSPIILLLPAFVVIVTIMFVANYRSRLVQELSGCKSAVKKVSTYGEQLIVISQENDVYTWNWNDLYGRPQIGSVNAQKAIAMSPGRVVWVPFARDDVLIMSNLRGDKELKRLPLGVGRKCKQIAASPNGKHAVIAFTIGGDSDRRIQLAAIDSDLTSIRPVETKTMEDGLRLNDVGISNDGTFIAAVGGSEMGWLLVAGANDKRMLWEHYVGDCNELNKVVFSPDGQMVYASEPGRTVYIFDIAAKKLVKRLVIDKHKVPANNPQTISSIAVSPDGHLLAAVSPPRSRVWVWDAKSGAVFIVINPSQYVVGDILFSPDSSQLATAELVGGSIKIWRLSDNP